MGAITLTNRKAIGLLAYLLIESNHAHSREFLLGLLATSRIPLHLAEEHDEIEQRYERAVQLLAAAETLRVRIGAPPEPINQNENADALTRLRAELGDVAFELALAKGATMTTEQVIALALS